MPIMKNIFEKSVAEEVIERINHLTPQSQPVWGKMSVAQMLAHCNVTYELLYENIHPRPGSFTRFLLKTFVKSTVTGEKPYKKNSPTASAFKVADDKSFEKEKARLIDYIRLTQSKGAGFFEGKESHSFGKLTSGEWNNMFYKHLDHHLSQFGV